MHSKINCGVKQGCTHSAQARSVKGFKMRGLRGFSEGRGKRLSVTSKHTESCPHSFFSSPPSLSPLSHHYSSIRSWAAQLFQDVRTTKLPWMRECEAQGGEGVWNSWPSGGASCSFVLQPLASWDTTEMSGWGGVVQYVQRVADGRGRGDGFSLFRVDGLDWRGGGGWGGQSGLLDQSWKKIGNGGVGDLFFHDSSDVEITCWKLLKFKIYLTTDCSWPIYLSKDGCQLWLHEGSLVTIVHDFVANVCTHMDGEPHPHMFMFCAQDTENYRENTCGFYLIFCQRCVT